MAKGDEVSIQVLSKDKQDNKEQESNSKEAKKEVIVKEEEEEEELVSNIQGIETKSALVTTIESAIASTISLQYKCAVVFCA